MREVELEDARPARSSPNLDAAPRSAGGGSRSSLRWPSRCSSAPRPCSTRGSRPAAARFAAVPGVVAPVGPDVRVPGALRTRWLVSCSRASWPTARSSGSASPTTGRRRSSPWTSGRATCAGRRRCSARTRSRALSLDRRVAGRCAPAAAHQLACLVSNGFRHFDKASSPAVVPCDGHPGRGPGHAGRARRRGPRCAPGATSMAVLPGLAVLGHAGSRCDRAGPAHRRTSAGGTRRRARART